MSLNDYKFKNSFTDSTHCKRMMVAGNINLILTQKLGNGTKLPKPEYNPNKDAYINIDTELKPELLISRSTKS
jgi:hypothetical protein